MNRDDVSIAPPQRYGKCSPASWGNARKNCASSRSNVAGRASSSGATRLPEVVDGVVAAPQDPVVGGQPEVVELVVGIGQALAPYQPIAASLLGGQRLRHERVVVDRHEQRRQPPEPAGVGRGGDHDVARLASSRRSRSSTVTPPARRRRPVTRVRSWIGDAAFPGDARDPTAQLRPDRASRPDPEADTGPRARAGSGPRPGPRCRSRNSSDLAVLGRLVDPRPELVDLVGLVGEGEGARSPRGRSRCRARA